MSDKLLIAIDVQRDFSPVSPQSDLETRKKLRGLILLCNRLESQGLLTSHHNHSPTLNLKPPSWSRESDD